jgi:hypothetical protein
VLELPGAGRVPPVAVRSSMPKSSAVEQRFNAVPAQFTATKGPFAPSAEFVHLARHQLFAGAALALDEDVNSVRATPFDLDSQPPHHAGRADEWRHGAGIVLAAGARPRPACRTSPPNCAIAASASHSGSPGARSGSKLASSTACVATSAVGTPRTNRVRRPGRCDEARLVSRGNLPKTYASHAESTLHLFLEDSVIGLHPRCPLHERRHDRWKDGCCVRGAAPTFVGVEDERVMWGERCRLVWTWWPTRLEWVLVPLFLPGVNQL